MGYWTEEEKRFQERMKELDLKTVAEMEREKREGKTTASKLQFYEERDKLNEEIIGNLKNENERLKARNSELEKATQEGGDLVE